MLKNYTYNLSKINLLIINLLLRKLNGVFSEYYLLFWIWIEGQKTTVRNTKSTII